MDVAKICRDMNPEIVSWRRELHRIPEVGNDLPQTAAYVKDKLEAWGIAYQTFESNSGIAALIGKREGKVVGLRADMDALPVAERTGLEFASGNGNMHACGHDAHTALLLGCAKFFKAHEDELNGRVKLIFQPGEEGTGGARIMAADGVLENPHVDAIIALHVGTFHKDLTSGDIAIGHGSVFASSYDEVILTVHGKGSHGAEPDQSVDPINIAQSILGVCQSVISRQFPPYRAGVFSITNINGGSGAFNIIGDTVRMTGTIRAQRNEDRDFIYNSVKEISSALAEAMGGTCEMEFNEPVNPVINDRAVTDAVMAAARKVTPPEFLKQTDRTLMIGEDAAEFWDRVPGTYFFLGTKVEGAAPEANMHHNPHFLLDETYLHHGAAVMIQSALDLLGT